MGPGALWNILRQVPKGLKDPRLLVGFETADDAAVYQVDEQTAIIQTVDFFPPMVDDPYTFGQIAAANALSDVYAMGGVPKLALNLLCFPSDKLPPETVAAILKGGQDKVNQAGAVLCGGHTVEDLEPKYGLAVTGFVHPKKVLTNSGARAGDVLILTKALGSGILSSAGKGSLLSPQEQEHLIGTMSALNKAAAEAMAGFDVHACTDITGFGLAGHGTEMAKGSGLSLELWAEELPLLPGVLNFAAQGILPGGLLRNKAHLLPTSQVAQDIDIQCLDVFFDPQTSGGLLIALGEDQAGALLEALKPACPDARVVGRVRAYSGLDLIITKG